MGRVQDEVFVADRDGSIRIFDTENWMSRMHTALPEYTQLADVIFVSAHGGPDGWGQFGGLSTYPNPDDYVPSFNFANHNPLVFSAACLTGNYAVGGQEDRNVAETMLANGAAVFIGSTEVSWGYPNREGAWKFFRDWDAGEYAGEVFTAMERSYWNANEDQKAWRFWITEYNYYGDPKFGAVSGGPLGNSEAVWQASGLEGSAITKSSGSLDVSVSDYVVYKDHYEEGLDRVEIPGGQVWLEPGKLMVPFYTVSIDYPRGYKIQDVILTNRSGLVNDTGVNVPMAPLNSTPSVCDPVPYSGTVEGFFPEDEYWWGLLKNPDGSSTLVVTLYPFSYNPLTTDVRFYKNYTFVIDYIKSNVTIELLRTDKDAYEQGAIVMVDLGLNNSGGPQDVVVGAVVKPYGSEEIVDGLLLSTLTNFTGPATFSTQWNSSGFEPGDYIVEVILRDTEGNVLDTETELFRLGISSGEITSFTATPEQFELGERVNITMTFANTGTVNLTGTAIVRVIDVTGGTVEEYRHNVTDLLPSDTISFRDTWNTTGAAEVVYSILGYVLYESRSTNPVSVMVSTETGGFDIGLGTYPSIAGTHTGTITPNQTMLVRRLYTYPCPGTGGHAEYVKICQEMETLVEAEWAGYGGDWQNITFDKAVTLVANQTYNYTIRTGSYPQIIHAQSYNATGGVITCSEFVDVNGKRHEDWIPAIRLS